MKLENYDTTALIGRTIKEKGKNGRLLLDPMSLQIGPLASRDEVQGSRMPASMEDYWKEEPRRSLVGRRKAKDWTGDHSTMMLSAYQVQPASTIYPLEEKHLLHRAKWQILKNRTIHHALFSSTVHPEGVDIGWYAGTQSFFSLRPCCEHCWIDFIIPLICHLITRLQGHEQFVERYIP